jgi:hypothetical protein
VEVYSPYENYLQDEIIEENIKQGAIQNRYD